MTKSYLWKLGVAGIVEATQSGARSATDIVEAAIERMDQVNSALNAVVMDLSDQARQRAADLDRARARGARRGARAHGAGLRRPPPRGGLRVRRDIPRCQEPISNVTPHVRE